MSPTKYADTLTSEQAELLCRTLADIRGWTIVELLACDGLPERLYAFKFCVGSWTKYSWFALYEAMQRGGDYD